MTDIPAIAPTENHRGPCKVPHIGGPFRGRLLCFCAVTGRMIFSLSKIYKTGLDKNVRSDYNDFVTELNNCVYIYFNFWQIHN